MQNIEISKYFTFKNVTFQTIETSKSLMYIATVIVDRQHYLFHAATAAVVQVVHKKIDCVKELIHNEKMYTKKNNCVKRFIHNRIVVHKKITCIKIFIHNKTFSVEISIWNCRYDVCIKHVQIIGRLFFLKGYEFSDNVTVTAVDDANLVFQNGSHFKMSISMVDGFANFIIQDISDIRMSEKGGGKTLLTLNMKCGRVYCNFETGAIDCMVSKDKITKAMVAAKLIFQNVSHFKMSTDCRVSEDEVEMSDGEGGGISHTQKVGGTSSTLNTSGDWGFVNSVTETTDCMVSEDVKSTLTLQDGSDIRFLAEGNFGILMELMGKSDQEFLEQVLALWFLLIAEMGVNKWIFSSSSFSSHQQILVSLRYRRCGGACVFRCDVILFHRKVRVQTFYAPGEGLQGLVDDERQSDMSISSREATDSHVAVHNDKEEGLVGDEQQSFLSVSSREATVNFAAIHKEPMAEEEMFDDVLHVIDEVEVDDVSQEEMFCEEEMGLVDEQQSFLSVSSREATVNFAAIHNEPMAEEEMIGDVLDVIDEVEVDDVSQEEMFCEEEMGLVDEQQSFLSVSSREATVNFAAIHKEPMGEVEMIGDVLHLIDEVEVDDVSQEEMFCEEEMGLVDEQQSFLSVSSREATVNFAAIHKEPMAEVEMIADVLHLNDEVEVDDVFQEEMFCEEEMGLVDEQQSFLSVSSREATVNFAAIHKEPIVEEEMKMEEDDVSQEEMFCEEEIGLVDDVSQKTFCDSSIFCPTFGSIKGATQNGDSKNGSIQNVAISQNSTSKNEDSKNGSIHNVAISQNSTSKNEDSKNGSIQNVAISKNSTSKNEDSKNGSVQMAKMSTKKASKSLSYTQDVSVNGQECRDDSQTASASTASFENNVFDEEFEAEEEANSQEEMSDEEDDVQHGVLTVRTGLSTVVNKVHDALAVMTREFMVIRAAVDKVCTADPQLSSALRAVQTGRCRAADGGRRERTLWQVIVCDAY